MSARGIGSFMTGFVDGVQARSKLDSEQKQRERLDYLMETARKQDTRDEAYRRGVAEAYGVGLPDEGEPIEPQPRSIGLLSSITGLLGGGDRPADSGDAPPMVAPPGIPGVPAAVTRQDRGEAPGTTPRGLPAWSEINAAPVRPVVDRGQAVRMDPGTLAGDLVDRGGLKGVYPTSLLTNPVDRGQARGMPASAVQAPAGEGMADDGLTVSLRRNPRPTDDNMPLGVMGAMTRGEDRAGRQGRAVADYTKKFFDVNFDKLIENEIRNGDPKLVRNLIDYRNSEEVKKGIDLFGRAAHAYTIGDADGVVENMFDAAKLNGLVIGYSPVPEKSGFLKGKDGKETGFRLVYKDDSTGKEATQDFASYEDFARQGLMYMDPNTRLKELYEDARKTLDERRKAAQDAASGANTEVVEIFDETTGQPRKMRYDRRTGAMTPLGGPKVPDAASGGTVAKAVQDRRSAADEMGLSPDDPAYQSYVLTGKMPREDQAPLTATDKKFIREADDMVTTNETAINMLNRAVEQSGNANEGWFAGARASTANNLPDWLVYDGISSKESGAATADLDNLVIGNALGQLKAVFGAAPTEGERQILMQLQGSINQPREVREKIYRRAIELAQVRLKDNRQIADNLRGGTYYKPGGAAYDSAAPQGSSSEFVPMQTRDGRQVYVRRSELGAGGTGSVGVYQSPNGGRLDHDMPRDRLSPPVGQPSSGSPPPAAGARQAPDGNWYVPDPNRPGKYLQVMP